MALLRILARTGWFVALAVGLSAPARAATATPQEVRAVFLLNLTRFMRWPDSAFADANAPLVIGCLADDALCAEVASAVTGEAAGTHPLQARRIRDASDISGCHVVYLADVATRQLVTMLGALSSQAVLTVSDSDPFLRLGGHVQFFRRGAQLKLRLDVRNLRQSGIVPSAQLLRVAEVVGR